MPVTAEALQLAAQRTQTDLDYLTQLVTGASEALAQRPRRGPIVLSGRWPPHRAVWPH